MHASIMYINVTESSFCHKMIVLSSGLLEFEFTGKGLALIFDFDKKSATFRQHLTRAIG